MRAALRLAWVVLTAVALGGVPAAQSPDGRGGERAEQALREEGEAVIALADAAAGGGPLPDDFALEWHNDFLKAQHGTFIPFIVTVTPPTPLPPAALLYVRAVRHGEGDRGPRGELSSYPFEDIYPVDPGRTPEPPFRFIRGFALQPGEYEVTVVLRERARAEDRGGRVRGGVLRKRLTVPDFDSGELATSTVILADHMSPAPESLSSAELSEKPYVIGGRYIEPARDARFRRDEELIVVFLVYNPGVRPDAQFDIEVEYHFFSRNGPGEAYLNRTEPQRFNPEVLGPSFEPAAGRPIMAGQGVPLAAFEPGDYRLHIRVIDRVAGRTIERDVAFTVAA